MIKKRHKQKQESKHLLVWISYRSSLSQIFVKVEHPVPVLEALKKSLQYRYFPVTFAKFLGTDFFTEYLHY